MEFVVAMIVAIACLIALIVLQQRRPRRRPSQHIVNTSFNKRIDTKHGYTVTFRNSEDVVFDKTFTDIEVVHIARSTHTMDQRLASLGNFAVRVIVEGGSGRIMVNDDGLMTIEVDTAMRIEYGVKVRFV
jgi:hypothetical protein